MSDIANTLMTLDRRMDAILAENPNGMTAQAQAEYDSVQRCRSMVQQAGSASLAGVNLATTEWGANLQTGAPQLLSRRQASTQLDYEQSQQAGSDGATTYQQPQSNVSQMNRSLPCRPLTAEQIFREKAGSSPFTSMEDMAWKIVQGQFGAQMAALGANTGTPADGGFLIPPEQVYEMLDKSVEDEIVRPRCQVEGMKYGEKTISTYDDSSHANGEMFGGLTLEWAKEGDDLNFQTPKLRQTKLSAKKCGFLCAATNEQMTDAPNYSNGLTSIMSTTLGFGLDRSLLITGLGGGQPVSCLKADSTITVAKESGQAADTIVWENITRMFSRMHPACIKNAVWIFNVTAIPQLLSMTIPTGTSGQHVPVMTGSAGNFQLLTRPVLFSEKMNPLGDLGDSMFVDLSQYLLGVMKDGFRLDQSSHLLFKSDQTVFRLIARIDGRPKWPSVFTPVNGDTLSWCVTLAAR